MEKKEPQIIRNWRDTKREKKIPKKYLNKVLTKESKQLNTERYKTKTQNPKTEGTIEKKMVDRSGKQYGRKLRNDPM